MIRNLSPSAPTNQPPQDLSVALQFSARLSDYSNCIAGRNRLLVANAILPIASSNIGNPNPNRVSIYVGVDLNSGSVISALQAGVTFGFKDPTGTIVFQTTLFSKDADVAAVTPSPFVYRPFHATVLELGPIIQYQPFLITSHVGFAQISVVEVSLVGRNLPNGGAA